MSYQANIPLATDRISKSQADINGNFTALAPFGNGYCDLPVQATPPVITGTDLGIYNATSTFSALPALFLRDMIGNISEFSTTQKNNVGNFVESWIQHPSGVFIKWGTVNQLLSAGANNFTFNATFPPFTQAPLVFLTPITNFAGTDPNSTYYVYNVTTTSFNVWAAPRTTGTASYYAPYWIAIGR